MNIQNVPPVNGPVGVDGPQDSNDSTQTAAAFKSVMDAQTKQTIDKATVLSQSMLTDKTSEDVIRKMPEDEYLHLLSLLDELISGSIDKHV